MPSLLEPVIPPGRMGAAPQPVIAGDGLVLRPWADRDIDVVMEAFADPDIQRWHFRRIDDVDEARAWIEDTRAGWQTEHQAHWAIVPVGPAGSPPVDRPVGRVALTPHLAWGRGEVSYWVLPAARGAGFATRAVLALTAWAFDDIGLHRLALNHSTQNPASCGVARVAGFAAEGTARSSQILIDGWHDMHLHGRVAPA